MNILLLGAAGQLGHTFLADGRLAALGSVTATSRNGEVVGAHPTRPLDITDRVAIRQMLDDVRPALIVNTAAYTAVDKAESDHELAMRVNAAAPGELGTWARANGACVLHFSTDYVFAGDASTPYKPSDPTGPRSVYGASKLAGEVALRASGASHVILRTAWVYSAAGHNFLRTMLRLGAERDTLRVVADQRGTPTSTEVIVSGSLALAARALAAPADMAMTHHLTAAGETTWHGFAEAIFDDAMKLGIMERRPAVAPITTDQYPTPARRPAYSVLDTASFVQTSAYRPPDWREALSLTLSALRTA